MPLKGLQVAWLVKNPPANAGDARDAVSIPRLGKSPRVGNGNPLQYSCLGNSMDRETWWAAVSGVTESNMTEQAPAHRLGELFHFPVSQ